MVRFTAQEPTGVAVQEMEVLVRTALFKTGKHVVQVLLQGAADRVDAAYQPKPGQQRKGPESATTDSIFGSFKMERDYYCEHGSALFSRAIQIVDFYHALEHVGEVLVALLGSKEHPDYKRRRACWVVCSMNGSGMWKRVAAPSSASDSLS